MFFIDAFGIEFNNSFIFPPLIPGATSHKQKQHLENHKCFRYTFKIAQAFIFDCLLGYIFPDKSFATDFISIEPV
jgi:hypothetical protein